MAIDLICTGCTHELSLKDELAGKRIKCPKCKAVIKIPEVAAPVARPSAAPAASRGAAGGTQPRPRYQRKKSSPTGLIIFVACLAVVAIAYPLASGSRAKSVGVELEANYSQARSKLREGNTKHAESLMYNCASRVHLTTPEHRQANEFKYVSTYAETLIANNSNEKAQSELSRCQGLATSSDQKARLALLRARGHSDRSQFETVIGHYRESLKQSFSREAADETLSYLQKLLGGLSGAVVSSRKDLRHYETQATDSEIHEQRVAADMKIPERRESLAASERVFSEAFSAASSILEVVRESEPGLASNFEALFLRLKTQSEQE